MDLVQNIKKLRCSYSPANFIVFDILRFYVIHSKMMLSYSSGRYAVFEISKFIRRFLLTSIFHKIHPEI